MRIYVVSFKIQIKGQHTPLCFLLGGELTITTTTMIKRSKGHLRHTWRQGWWVFVLHTDSPPEWLPLRGHTGHLALWECGWRRKVFYQHTLHLQTCIIMAFSLGRAFLQLEPTNHNGRGGGKNSQFWWDYFATATMRDDASPIIGPFSINFQSVPFFSVGRSRDNTGASIYCKFTWQPFRNSKKEFYKVKFNTFFSLYRREEQ